MFRNRPSPRPTAFSKKPASQQPALLAAVITLFGLGALFLLQRTAPGLGTMHGSPAAAQAAEALGLTSADGLHQSCPVAPRPITPPGTGFFSDISDASGIRDQNFVLEPGDNMKINDHSRLAFGDLDGDGYDDIVAHNLFPNPNQVDPVPFEHLVFLNNRDGTFRNHSDASGLRDIQAGFFLFGDVDNDGDQDVFAGLDMPIPGPDGRPRPDNAHRILLNDGEAHFTELPNSGVNVPFRDQNGSLVHFAGNAVFLDADGDANLDLFVGNGQSSAAVPDQFWFGRGDGRFEPASERMQDWSVGKPTNGSTTCDYDGDGDTDIFVSVYGISILNGHNGLLENDGKGLFYDKAMERGFHALATGNYFLPETGFGRDPEPGRSPAQYVGGNGFGLACEDINNDGLADVFMTNISHPNSGDYGRTWSDPSQLLINQGADGGFGFVNEWLDRGLPFNEGDVDGSAVDFDNDGYFDLAISRDRKYEGSYPDVEQKSWFGLMHQLADGRFESLGPQSGINDMDNDPPELLRMKAAQNHAWADVDRDGDLDLLVGGRSGGKAGRANFLFQNEIGSQNDWLAIRLEGDGEIVNRDAIGARVQLAFADRVLSREVKSSRGMYNSMDTRTLHFGLGDLGCDFSLRVVWPDGKRMIIPGNQVPRNTFVTLRYADEEIGPTATPGASPTPSSYAMSGRILANTAEPRLPIPGASITLTELLSGEVLAAVSSDAEGRYALSVSRVPRGTWRLQVRSEGFELHSEDMPPSRLAGERDIFLTPLPEPTPTPPGDLTVHGRVFGASAAPGAPAPVEGARLALSVCVPQAPIVAVSDASGAYSLIVPAQFVAACANLELEIRAAGYATFRQSLSGSALRLDPERDFVLAPAGPAALYLPRLLRP